MIYEVATLLHAIGTAVLLGAGLGLAFILVVSHQSRKPGLVAHVTGLVVLADWVFIGPSLLVLLVSGYGLSVLNGFGMYEGWLGLSLILFAVIVLLWFLSQPMQIHMRNLAREARETIAPLPNMYHRLFRRWFVVRTFILLGVLGCLWLMLSKTPL